MSPRVTFYDVPPEGRDARVVRLAEAAWERGRKLLVRCADAETARRLDELLWTYSDAAFVPHEVVPPGSAPTDPELRIALVTSDDDPIRAEVLLCEAPVPFDVAERYDFVMELVDQRSPEALAASRARFRTWRERGANPEFRPG